MDSAFRLKAVLNLRAVKPRYAPKQSLEARLPVFGWAPKGGSHELLGTIY
jgi:hypothetical protein